MCTIVNVLYCSDGCFLFLFKCHLFTWSPPVYEGDLAAGSSHCCRMDAQLNYYYFTKYWFGHVSINNLTSPSAQVVHIRSQTTEPNSHQQVQQPVLVRDSTIHLQPFWWMMNNNKHSDIVKWWTSPSEQKSPRTFAFLAKSQESRGKAIESVNGCCCGYCFVSMPVRQ